MPLKPSLPRTCAALALLTSTWAFAADVRVQLAGADGRPLPQAVVSLESPAARAAVQPGRDISIAQVGMRFEPRVTVVPVGTPVAFPNHDTVRHHVYSFSAAKTFELKLYSGTPAQPVVFDRAGVAVLRCNIHGDMVAGVVVVDTPYHARTDAHGQALLAGVPPGAYRLRVWHQGLPEGARPHEQPLDVPAGGASVTLRLTPANRP